MATIAEALETAVKFHRAGQLQQAAGIYQKILEVQPENADAAHLSGLVAHQCGDHATAIVRINKALAIAPERADYHFNLGTAYFALRRFEEAAASYERAVELQADYLKARLGWGAALKEIGKLDQAEDCIRQVIQAAPHNAEAHDRLGVVLSATGQFDEAIEHHRRAVAIQPQSATALSNLGSALGRQGRVDEAIPYCQQALTFNPRSADALNNLGNLYKQQSNFEIAEAHYRRALQIKPESAEYLSNLGSVLKEQAQYEASIDCYRKSLELAPQSTTTRINLGNVLLAQGQYDEAGAVLREASARDPNSVEALTNLGIVLLKQGKLEEAVATSQQAVALRPESATAHNSLGSILRELGRYDEAIDCHIKALELEPSLEGSHLNLAINLAQQGQFQKAADMCRRELEQHPENLDAYDLLAGIRELSADDSEMANLESLWNNEEIATDKRISACFSLGKTYDQLGLYDRAIERYHAGNRFRAAELPYNPQQTVALVDQIVRTFSRELFAERQGMGSPSTLPVFIVGMPRSGTTLVEQIISSHPQAYGAGELEDIDTISGTIGSMPGISQPYPAGTSDLGAQAINALAERYLNRIQRECGDATRVTDKMPGNSLHLGLISLLFPQARVIHCRRHPLDVCLSCYFQNFKSIPFSFNIEHLCSFYQQHQRAMEHWRDVLPIEILEVDYADVVEDQEGMSRKLIDFCGLDWDDQCLSFHENQRPIKTASLWQVRQPIYTSSIDRWKNYEQHLEPFKRALEGVPGILP